MNRFSSLASLLSQNLDLEYVFNASAVFRLMPDGSVVVIEDSLRGTVELEPGVDLVFAKPGSEPELGFNGPVDQELVNAMLDAMPAEGKPWRFGFKGTGRVVVYGAEGKCRTITANVVVFDDNGETVGLTVSDSGVTIGEEVAVAAIETTGHGAQA